MSELVCEGLGATEGRRILLDGVDLRLPAGEMAILFSAPRVCGRQLLQVLAGRQLPTVGEVRLGAVSLRDDPARYRRRVGYVGPELGLPRWLTVEEWLDAQPCRSASWSAQLRELFELGPLLERWVDQLDPLATARVAFVRALMPDPELLLLDRPFHWRDAAQDSVRARANRTRPPLSPAALEARLAQERAAHELLIDEWREMLVELAAMGKAVVVRTEEPPRLASLRHRLLLIEDGRPLPAELARRVGPRLGLESYLRIRSYRPEESGLLAEALVGTQGMRRVRQVGEEVIATYAGPFHHGRARVESRADAIQVDLAKVKPRSLRPSRLPFEY